jgi:hypothetical protein
MYSGEYDVHCKKSIFALSYFNTLNLRKMQFLLSLRVFLLEYAEYNFKLKHLSKIFWVNRYRLRSYNR